MTNVRPIKARITNAAGATRVDVYDDIGEGGWFSEGLTAKSFANQLSGITGPLEVHINSGGGDVWDGLSIKNAIEAHKGPVTTVVDGIAASIASIIAQAGTDRVMMPGSMMMIHDAFTVAAGNAAELSKMASTLDDVSNNLAAVYARAAGGTAETWRDAMREETWYTAEQAVAAGLADRTGDGSAALPAGLDLDQFAGAIPGQIAAQLRTLPRVQAAAPLHDPFTGQHTHPHATGGSQGDDATHEHAHTHDGDANHGHAHPANTARARIAAADGGSTPWEPQEYQGDDGETVSCPGCESGNGPDARFCDQCGMKLVGRDDVAEVNDSARRPIAGRLLGVESMPILDKALPVHHTATEDSAWDGPAAVAAMANDDAVLRYCHAWMSDEAAAETPKEGDDDADDQKASYKFPHHRTKGGPANLAACRNGLARLSGANIPDADRAGVKAHLQAHLDDASKGADGTTDHAGPPAWLRDEVAHPAWLNSAEEAK